MTVFPSNTSGTVDSEHSGQAATAMLRSVLGYDSMTDQADPTADLPPYAVSVISTIDDMRLRADWARLETDGIASVFQAWSWQRGLTEHLLARTGAEPLFVTIHDALQARVVAIFPLQRRIWRGLRVIEYLGADFCDTCQPLIAGDLALSTADAGRFAEALISALPPADLLRLTKMGRSLFGLANPFADLPGARPSADETFPLELGADRPGFVSGTSACKTYQKQWRKLARRDGIAFELFDTPEAISAAFDAMIAMRTSRFSALDRDDLLNEPDVAAFYRRMALLPAPECKVRIAGLKVGEVYTAYIYMMDDGRKFSTVISAIDDSVGNAYAPGLILFTKIFERAAEAGYISGDIGIGYMHYKTRFAARKNPLFQFERPLSLKGGIALTGIDAARGLKQFARNNGLIRKLAETLLRRKIAGRSMPKVETPEDE